MHVHFVENRSDRAQCRPHLGLAEIPDAADAEGVGDGQFAGIDQKALGTQSLVEIAEVEMRIGRHVEGHNDRGLVLSRQQTAEPQSFHAIDEHLVVSGVTGTPAGHTAFGSVFVERQ